MTENTAADKPYTDPVCGMKVVADPNKSIALTGLLIISLPINALKKNRTNPQQYPAPHVKTNTL